MKILHILRSQPDAPVQGLLQSMSEGRHAVEVPLYAADDLDYDWLVDQIFASDRVFCWW